MGLTILAFVAIPGFVLSFLVARRRGKGTAGGRAIMAMSMALAVYCLGQGLVFIFTGPGFRQADALAMERLSGVALAAAYALVFLFPFYFPKPWPSILCRLGMLIAVPAFLFAAYDIVATYDYIISVYRPWASLFRMEGSLYKVFVFGEAGVAALSAAILGIRALASKSKVQKQRVAIAALAVAAGAGAILLSMGIVSAGEELRPSLVYAPIGTFILAGGLAYAFNLSRLFDWRAIGRTALGYGALLLAVGLPAGLAVAALAQAGRAAAVIGTPVAFALAALLGRRFIARFFERLLSRGDYRERLVADLAALDLSQGRDAVLGQVDGILKRALDLTGINVLIEDDKGMLRTVWSTTGARATVERGSALSAMLESVEATIVMKFDAVNDPDYESARDQLVALFESLSAEALVMIREGRRAIGVMSLGPRRSGADYTAYDIDTFKTIYGKLFVVAYYLKNIAKESIMTTVDREVALSDQVIRFALEKVDRFDHPDVDASWISRSTRSLGGDFIDSIRLSKDRWFLVMGDVSGKGLSASMNMLILKSMIRTFLRVEKDFIALVSRVNAFIKENLPRGTFFAGVFGYFDLSKSVFYYINCGVPAMMLYSPAFDTFIDVQGEGRILGFAKDVSSMLRPRKLALPAGSTLVAATDGALDSENLRGERFGAERLRRSIHGRLALSSSDITAGVVDDLMSFTDNRQEDDVTVLAIKFAQRSAK
jgi:hypothetical protein